MTCTCHLRPWFVGLPYRDDPDNQVLIYSPTCPEHGKLIQPVTQEQQPVEAEAVDA